MTREEALDHERARWARWRNIKAPVIFVGECAPEGHFMEYPSQRILTRDGKTHLPLYFYPSRSAGGRLAEWCGCSHSDYTALFGHVNLFPLHRKSWRNPEAHVAAAAIKDEIERNNPGYPYRVVVTLGSRVAKAFLPGFNGHIAMFDRIPGEVTYITLPHPSARNLLWSDANNIDKARSLLTEAVTFARQQMTTLRAKS